MAGYLCYDITEWLDVCHLNPVPARFVGLACGAACYWPHPSQKSNQLSGGLSANVMPCAGLKVVEVQPSNRPTSGSTRHGQAAGFWPAMSVPKMNVLRYSRRLSVRLNLDVGRSTTEPQSTTSELRAPPVITVRSRVPRLRPLDWFVKHSL